MARGNTKKRKNKKAGESITPILIVNNCEYQVKLLRMRMVILELCTLVYNNILILFNMLFVFCKESTQIATLPLLATWTTTCTCTYAVGTSLSAERL